MDRTGDTTFAARIEAMRPPAGSLGIGWLGQAGFALRGSATTLLIDPYLVESPERVVPPADRPEPFGFVDAVLATHEHIDHLDLPTWPALAAAGETRFVAPVPIVDQVLAAGISADRVTGAVVDQEIRIGDAVITPVPARHGVHVADAYTFGHELSGGLHRYLGYVVELNGVRIYHAGDSIIYDGMAERLRRMGVDIAMLPINGRDHYREQQDLVGNLSYREAADLAAEIGVEIVIPMHYEMFAGNLERPGTFVDYLRAAHPDVTAVVPGRYGQLILTPTRNG